MAEFDLSHYSNAPLFNTKVVVQETGVTAATLRAWERRYGVPEPNRTNTNYRLYSERDIALIRWLRDRVAAGISISQAVELYHRMIEGKEMPSSIPGEAHRAEQPLLTDHAGSQRLLIAAFKAFDELRADAILAELFALYSVEDVLTTVIQPAMVEIGEQWHRGEVTVPVEHFASAYVERKLMTLLNAQPVNADAPLIVTGCAPHEHHELGVLLFSLFLRRNGLRVLYLGQNVPLIDLSSTLKTLKPAMLILSASSQEAAHELQPIAAMIQALAPPRPLFGFGGAAFQRDPALIESIAGVYLGADSKLAARDIGQHLRQM